MGTGDYVLLYVVTIFVDAFFLVMVCQLNWDESQVMPIILEECTKKLIK